jgi:hypothetical protein
MRKLLLLTLVVSLSSCGLFKKVHKENTLDKIQTTSVAKSDSTSLTVDKSVTTIKEKADTTVIIPEKVVSQEVDFNMDSLVNGMTAVQNKLIDIRFLLDPATNKLTTTATIKPQGVSFVVNKETTIQKDISSQENVAKEIKNSAKEVHEHDLVDKKPFGTFWIVVIILGVVGIFVFAVYKRSGGS